MTKLKYVIKLCFPASDCMVLDSYIPTDVVPLHLHTRNTSRLEMHAYTTPVCDGLWNDQN